MSRHPIPAALAAALLLLTCSTAGAAPAAAVGSHDIGALMSRAEEHFALASHDAIILLEHETVELAPGTRTTTVHRIVWFSTEMGLDAYADLRVPHNTATSTLEVVALRTWMDGRWWPHESEISPTAVVPTTPSAVQNADDYTVMRETMLLHDGVELPCIVETVYTITQELGPVRGSDGVWIFSRTDPVVASEFVLRVPKGTRPLHAEGNGAPAPVIDESGAGHDVYEWSAGPLDRLPRPLVADAAGHTPYVAWSMWESWAQLGTAVRRTFDEAAVATAALADSVARRIEGKPVPHARAEAIVEFVNESTRAIRYDESFWRFAPRPAARTWSTAYGHRLDRAVLAGTLFGEAGFEVTPVFAGRGIGPVDGNVPTLGRFDGMLLEVRSGRFETLYDPSAGVLLLGNADLSGHSIWVAGEWSEPQVVSEAAGTSRYELVVSLEPGEESGWTGTGLLSAAGALSPYRHIAGLSGETGGYLRGVAGSVLDGCEVEEHSVAALHIDGVEAGFEVSLDDPEPDELDRTRLVIGDPRGGVMSALPPDVHLHTQERRSPVRLPGAMAQVVTLRIELTEEEIVRLPDEVSLSNALGSFALTVTRERGVVTIARELKLGAAGVDATGAGGSGGPAGADAAEAEPLTIAPEDWPLLRELLLEEADPSNRTIILE